MALTLSAIHVGAIGFAPAAALVLGSEVGTNVKILLSGIGGNATKKRVALGNFFFKVVSMVVATRSRVGASSLFASRTADASSWPVYFTRQVCLYSPSGFNEGEP